MSRPPSPPPSDDSAAISNQAYALNAMAEHGTTNLSDRSRAYWQSYLTANPEICDEISDATRAWLVIQGVTACG